MQGLSIYFPSGITRHGKEHATAVRGASGKAHGDDSEEAEEDEEADEEADEKAEAAEEAEENAEEAEEAAEEAGEAEEAAEEAEAEAEEAEEAEEEEEEEHEEYEEEEYEEEYEEEEGLVSSSYEKLAEQQKALVSLLNMYKTISSAVTGESAQQAATRKRKSRSHSPLAIKDAASPSGQADSTGSSVVEATLRLPAQAWDEGNGIVYYVTPEKGVTADQMLQMMGFAHPFNASTMLVTQVRGSTSTEPCSSTIDAFMLPVALTLSDPVARVALSVDSRSVAATTGSGHDASHSLAHIAVHCHKVPCMCSSALSCSASSLF
jgi:hypothetical protein